jgi:uncharacterized glyoxalase superfamily protein PhnB/predicted enzyme related to lactoylglutathione lyase
MIVNRSAPPGPVVPRLSYKDVGKAIPWLCGAFGFAERLRTPPETDGSIRHAQLAIGAGSVILTCQQESRPQVIMVPVKDIDSHCEHATRFGARVVNPLATHAYGERQYTAEDLEGHHWTFSQSVSDVDPVEWGALAKEIKGPPAQKARPSFCYLQIPAVDVRKSAEFYESTFGWNIRGRDKGHPSFDDAAGNISGAWVEGRPPSRDPDPGLLPYIWVDDIHATLTMAITNGAALLDSPHPDNPGSTSLIATFHDPAGNVIGLYQEAS